MRKIQYVLMVLIVMFVLAACSKKETVTWQEQYDLGMQYLTEGDYEAAIVAFTAAIEIDSKNTDTYLARANAFELSSDNDDYLALAIADYEMALNIDETIVDAYLGLANIYSSGRL